MSSNNRAVHSLLYSSCENMLLYFQELASHLERDVTAMSAELNLLFANEAVALGDEDEHQDGQVLSKEEAAAKEKKLKNFKELAGKNENFKKFSAKYGKQAAKTLLGLLTMRFTANPAGYGADDYVAIVGHLFTGTSELQSILLSKYPKVAEVVGYIASKTATKTESQEFRKIFAKASEDVADSHRISSATQARYLNFTTEKDRETIAIVGILGVMDVQLRSCFNAFFQEESQVPGLAQKVNAKKPSDEGAQQTRLIERDLENGLELLVDIKQKEFSEMDDKDAKMKNAAALELAILNKKKSFKTVSGEKLNISIALGVESNKMSAAQRLKTVDDMEVLRSEQANRLLIEAKQSMQEDMADIQRKRKPSKAKIEKFQNISEMDAIAKGKSDYQLSPEADSKGEMHFGHTPMKEGKNGINEKLRLLGARLEQNKIANKAISALISFIDTLRHLPDLIETPKLKRTQPAPNMHSKPETSFLKKRSLSDANIVSKRATDNQLVTASTSSPVSWFAPVKPNPTNADIRTINKIVSMVPRLLRMPGIRST